MVEMTRRTPKTSGKFIGKYELKLLKSCPNFPVMGMLVHFVHKFGTLQPSGISPKKKKVICETAFLQNKT